MPVKTMAAKVFGVSRSALYAKTGSRRRHYNKPEDQIVVSAVKAILDNPYRSHYGSLRITALINRQRCTQGLEPWNHKRIARVLAMYGLSLPKPNHRIRHQQRTGQIKTIHSNIRWCTDVFEFQTIHGDRVYVVFIMDCCDRECIGCIAKLSPIVKQDIQSLMIQCVEMRFNQLNTPGPIQLLSDRGSIYRSMDTISIARSLGLSQLLYIPPKSSVQREALSPLSEL